MIDVDQARSLVLNKARIKSAVSVPLNDALAMVLAEDITSDVDSPPHDKSLVDGYALRADDLINGSAKLRVLEEVTAGQVPQQSITPGTAIRIMTGAPIPAGAEAVVMVERTEQIQSRDGSKMVRISHAGVALGQNIMRRASSLSQGQVVLQTGHEIRPMEIGLLSEVGRSDVLVIDRPRVAVLATGNELVPVGEKLSPGQIRNSNGPMLSALVRRAGGTPVDLGIARDDRDELLRLITRGLEHDVLLLSGGVSAGDLDLVPAVMSQLGVEQVFHKVNLKPGKPLWFGLLSSGGAERLVFGLPGNPVSSLVCFELFVRPALGILTGKSAAEIPWLRASLSQPHTQRGDRPTYWPAAVRRVGSRESVQPLDWRGSADLRTLVEANGLCYFPAGDKSYKVGQEVSVYPL